MPCPRPMKRQFRRRSSVASASRGNHASGAETSRPSARMTISRASVTVTSMAVASGLTAKVVIPGLQEGQAILHDEQSDLIELVRSKPMGLRDTNWVKPNLGDAVAMLDMNVRCLRSLSAIEEEAKSQDAQHGRHI